jgi:hypothetical protein
MAKRNKAKGQTTQWPNEKRQKDRQHNDQKKKDKRTLFVLLSFFFWPLWCLFFCPFSFGHCVVCPFFFFWPKTKGQTTQWPKEKRQKDKQHNGQKKKDKRTDNTMAKRKKIKGQTTQ